MGESDPVPSKVIPLSGSPRRTLQQVACFFVLQGKEAKNHVRMAATLETML